MSEDTAWKVCSSCKSPIAFGQRYWVCNVSTCNTKRNPMFFCRVACWDAHVPMMRHRKSWAIEKRAPTRDAHEKAEAAATTRAKEASERKAASAKGREERQAKAARPVASARIPHEVLIVVSRLKRYVTGVDDLRVSDRVFEALSDHVRSLCDDAIEVAIDDGRKTVMDRDFETPLGPAEGQVLIVVSRLKDYIRAKAGMNTSGNVPELLSRHVRHLIAESLKNARRAERGTVLDRDVPELY